MKTTLKLNKSTILTLGKNALKGGYGPTWETDGPSGCRSCLKDCPLPTVSSSDLEDCNLK